MPCCSVLKADKRFSSDVCHPGVILSNQSDKPQTFYFVRNAADSCNPPSAAGGGTPDNWITLTKSRGEVFVPRPPGYRGRIQRGPLATSGAAPDLSQYKLATYAEINMDAFPCSYGNQNMHVAEADVSLNHGYDGPIVVHSTNPAGANPDVGQWGNPLKGGFTVDIAASGPPPGQVEQRQDGTKGFGYDTDGAGAPINHGLWTNYYSASLSPLQQHTPDYGSGKTTANIAYWSNAQDGVTVPMSANYLIKVEFH